MTIDPPLSDLPGATAWLGGLSPGAAVEIGSADFDPSVTPSALAALPGADPLSLTVTTVDAAAATLVGTGTVAGEAGCTVTLRFTATADDPLELAVDVALPAGATWTPIAGSRLSFGGLEATVTPVPGVGASTFSLSGGLLVDGTNVLSATLTLPAVAGADWTLVATGSPDLTGDLLSALAGADVLQLLPADLQVVGEMTLTDFSLAFTPSGSVTRYAIGLGFAKLKWRPFGTDDFEITGLSVEVVGRPQQERSLEAIATAATTIDGVPVDISVAFPEVAIFATIGAGSTLNSANVFSGFHATAPTRLPTLAFSSLSFTLFPTAPAFELSLAIDESIAITDKVALDRLHFDLGVEKQTSSAETTTITYDAHGDVYVQFSFGATDPKTILILQGRYASDGSLSVSGSVEHLDLGSVIDGIVSQFGIDRTTIPGAIDPGHLVLDELTVAFDRAGSTDAFSLTCTGHAEVAGVDVTFAPSLHLTLADTTWSLEVDGTLVIGEGASTRTFGIELRTSQSDTSVTATYSGDDPLTMQDLGALLHLDLPAIPSELDLDLVQLGFHYDFATGDLVVGAESTNAAFEKAVLVSKGPPTATGGSRQSVLLVQSVLDLRLSELPMVGSTLARLGDVALTDPAVAIAEPSPVTQDVAGVLNQLIQLVDHTYPTLPTEGLPGAVQISGSLAIAGSAPQPVHLTLATPSTAAPATATPALVAAASGAASPGTWFAVQKSIGPVTIQKIGLRYADGSLWALLNADLQAGPVDFGLLGLGVGSPFSSTPQPHFTVDGVTLAIDAGPVQLTGALVGQLDPLDLYGELSLTLPGLSIGAIGGYADHDGAPSCFIYAVIDAELGGPPFAFVTGLAAGFGFNRTLVIPSVGQLAQFPLVAWATGNGPTSTPSGDIGAQVQGAMQQLEQQGVIAPQVGEQWFAAGVRFTSFEILDTFALLTVKVGDEVEIDLLGLSTLSLPPADPKPIAVAQLALVASFAPAKQELSVLAQLTPASFLFDRACHLTGGFAFCWWWGADHPGDFVVTLGGYSPCYTKPDHYPDVPRLGIDWKVDDNLSISGDAYFALTPSAVMAGGGMKATWSSGAVSAWFSVEADFLLLFHPIHYHASASIELGASVRVHLWFTSFTLSVHLGVEAELWGPPFGVRVEVKLHIVSFTISFGPDEVVTTAVDWPTFVTKVLPGTPNGSPAQLALAPPGTDAATAPDPTVAPVVQINAATGVRQVLPAVPGAQLPLDWTVDPDSLVLTVTSTVPLKQVTYRSTNVTLQADPQDRGRPNVDIGVGPTRTAATDLVSSITITASALADEGAVLDATQVLTPVPAAVWAVRTLDDHGVPTGVDPLNGTTISDALTGVTIVPRPQPAQATVAIPVGTLELTTDGGPIDLAWSEPVLATSDPFSTETVHGTISTPVVSANRAALIAAVRASGFAVADAAVVDVSTLADAASGALLSPPLLRRLTEAR